MHSSDQAKMQQPTPCIIYWLWLMSACAHLFAVYNAFKQSGQSCDFGPVFQASLSSASVSQPSPGFLAWLTKDRSRERPAECRAALQGADILPVLASWLHGQALQAVHCTLSRPANNHLQLQLFISHCRQQGRSEQGRLLYLQHFVAGWRGETAFAWPELQQRSALTYGTPVRFSLTDTHLAQI